MEMTSLLGKELIKDLHRAAQLIRNARALIITSGAGIGVDSGLPDFRGPGGFWNAFPSLKKDGIHLSSMSNPQWFDSDPEFAWGFFGYRYNLYSQTWPHPGFSILHKWANRMAFGYFVYTSNVDGQFQKAGFDPDSICECHGSINYLQCTDPSISSQIWEVPEGTIYSIDVETLRANPPLPMGPPGRENDLARPNILMFSDWGWVSDRTDKQNRRFESFRRSLLRKKGVPFVVIEIGAGFGVPTVRMTSEMLVEESNENEGTLIRINPIDDDTPKGHISLKLKALEALQEIDKLMT